MASWRQLNSVKTTYPFKKPRLASFKLLLCDKANFGAYLNLRLCYYDVTALELRDIVCSLSVSLSKSNNGC